MEGSSSRGFRRERMSRLKVVVISLAILCGSRSSNIVPTLPETRTEQGSRNACIGLKRKAAGQEMKRITEYHEGNEPVLSSIIKLLQFYRISVADVGVINGMSFHSGGVDGGEGGRLIWNFIKYVMHPAMPLRCNH